MSTKRCNHFVKKNAKIAVKICMSQYQLFQVLFLGRHRCRSNGKVAKKFVLSLYIHKKHRFQIFLLGMPISAIEIGCDVSRVMELKKVKQESTKKLS